MKSTHLVLMFLAVAVTVSVFATAQPPTKPTKDEVPEAALLTERGTQLADRLRWLRRAEEKLGDKHPSLVDIRKQIADIKEELKAWKPDTANPFDQASINGMARKIPKMNGEDLRQLVLRLTNEIAELKDRVAKLERQNRAQ